MSCDELAAKRDAKKSELDDTTAKITAKFEDVKEPQAELAAFAARGMLASMLCGMAMPEQGAARRAVEAEAPLAQARRGSGKADACFVLWPRSAAPSGGIETVPHA